MEKDFYLSHIALQINQPKVRYPQKMTEKIKNILKLLSTTKINKDFLQEYSFQGIPDECNGLRSLCWKILLGYLPYWPSRWETTLAISRNKYAKLVKEHILSNPKLISKSPRKSLSDGDNILKSVEGINTQGNMFEATKEPRLSDKTHVSTSDRTEDKLWNEIGKDTKRTRSGMHFFQQAVDVVLDNKENIEKSQVESHIDVLTRILYIYGKTHPEIGYTQGMNELLAPIYYCFANDQNPAFKGHAEADSYFCFEAMMEELKDSFIQMLNKKEVGIQARIQRMDKILQKLDVEVWKHLNNHDVQPFFYSLRWLMLLLTQEFELTEVLRLWDTLFGHTQRFEYLNYICIGMIQQVRDKLMETKDFSTLMSILQKESACDLDEVLSLAFRLYKKHTTPEDSLPQIIFLV